MDNIYLEYKNQENKFNDYITGLKYGIGDISKINSDMHDLEELIGNMSQLKERRSKIQLTNQKKLREGFSLSDSVVDIGQGEFGLSTGDDVLYTYGIEPCCGVAVVDGEKKFLCHLDGKNQPSEVIELVNDLNFSHNSKVIIIPGVTCGMPGSFDYKKLKTMFEEKGFVVSEQRIPSTFGFVVVNSKQVIVGTNLDRSQNISFSLNNEKKL